MVTGVVASSYSFSHLVKSFNKRHREIVSKVQSVKSNSDEQYVDWKLDQIVDRMRELKSRVRLIKHRPTKETSPRPFQDSVLDVHPIRLVNQAMSELESCSTLITQIMVNGMPSPIFHFDLDFPQNEESAFRKKQIELFNLTTEVVDFIAQFYANTCDDSIKDVNQNYYRKQLKPQKDKLDTLKSDLCNLEDEVIYDPSRSQIKRQKCIKENLLDLRATLQSFMVQEIHFKLDPKGYVDLSREMVIDQQKTISDLFGIVKKTDKLKDYANSMELYVAAIGTMNLNLNRVLNKVSSDSPNAYRMAINVLQMIVIYQKKFVEVYNAIKKNTLRPKEVAEIYERDVSTFKEGGHKYFGQIIDMIIQEGHDQIMLKQEESKQSKRIKFCLELYENSEKKIIEKRNEIEEKFKRLRTEEQYDKSFQDIIKLFEKYRDLQCEVLSHLSES